MATPGMNGLYPPLLDTILPAFSIDSNEINITNVRLSPFNSENDIKHFQIIITRQDNNKSVVFVGDSNNIGWKNHIIVLPFTSQYYTLNEDGTYSFKISIAYNMNFSAGSVYKLQMRFGNCEAPSKAAAIPKWFNDNLDYFSEWSTVMLLLPIKAPSFSDIEIFAVTDKASEITGEFYKNLSVPFFSFSFNYLSGGSAETLNWYQAFLCKGVDNEPIESSDIIYNNQYNTQSQFQYSFKTQLSDNSGVYCVKIKGETRNGFPLIAESEKVTCYKENIQEQLISARVFEEECFNEICIYKIGPLSDLSSIDSIEIKRYSSKTSDNKWETLVTFTRKQLEEVFVADKIYYRDMLVEGGVVYKYIACIQYDKTKYAFYEDPVPYLIMPEHIYLLDNQKQLKIMLNPSISSFAYTVADGKVDTIGGRYPFIKRNANTKYATFPISGTISAEMDFYSLFTNEEELYGENIEIYKAYHQDMRDNQRYDYIKEKLFREKVIEFLYKDNVKLFKSGTEGNFLVRLMEVSFTPNQTLGRLIYDFSCNAYEIEECTLENLKKYGIENTSLDKISIIDNGNAYFMPPFVDSIPIIQAGYREKFYDTYMETRIDENGLRTVFTDSNTVDKEEQKDYITAYTSQEVEDLIIV